MSTPNAIFSSRVPSVRNTFCGIKPIELCQLRKFFFKFLLSKNIFPDVGLIKPVIIFNNVDLPTPLFPTKPTIDFLFIVKLILFIINSFLLGYL